ncbi:acid phosphatase [Tistlia consotensis]|uniref:Acid phosphatase n=1 Tax=Tistlia consotensis USBA 355 TaxID=560819 RepID=A0A1Y6BNH7_9PROT|nr:HAD family acid phosphatase [Tistlia consotensis]SMF20262.1 acid phosphatase [Tistlia consotensis USBA 355]SNR48019.1 acid phosphatase [Tistlia consotensis]
MTATRQTRRRRLTRRPLTRRPLALRPLTFRPLALRPLALLAPAVVALALLLQPAALRAEPRNLDLVTQELTAYHDSGAYAVELAEVDQQALQRIEHRAATAAPGAKLALVLDIDETSVSNWPDIVANGFAFLPNAPCRLDGTGRPSSPCGNNAWNGLAAAPAIEPTLALAKRAAELGVAIFFITGRHEHERAATEKNLRGVGYPAWQQLYLQPDKGPHLASAADFKAPVRARIEAQGYSIVANIGDQVSDLTGGHAEAVFKLPNPFYRIK